MLRGKHTMKKLTLVSLSACIAFALPAVAEQIDINDGNLNALDANGDGAVSKAEFDTFTGFAFEKMDKDGDGSLSPDEVDDHVVGDAFNMLDDDGNGSVSSGEFSSQMEEDFKAADKDGDGLLN
jgi:Ca2+-binding EF-hand superfamily protein